MLAQERPRRLIRESEEIELLDHTHPDLIMPGDIA